MKKTLAMLLAAVMLLAMLTACGSGNNAASNNAGNTTNNAGTNDTAGDDAGATSAYGDFAGSLIEEGARGMTLRELYEERVPLYEKYADVTIDETGRTSGQVVDQLRMMVEWG